jgi:AcrR family transcriptional regulator
MATQAKAVIRQRGEEQTRERILGVAAEWFGAHGYAATSIRDIAREVGVTVGAIYVHFPSKDRLLVAVYEEGVRRIGEAVDAVPESAEPWERLEAAAQAHLEALLDNAGFARVIVRVIPTDGTYAGCATAMKPAFAGLSMPSISHRVSTVHCCACSCSARSMPRRPGTGGVRGAPTRRP